MLRLRLFFMGLRQAVAFIERARARREARERAVREHQLRMVELITNAVKEVASANSATLTPVLEAMTAQTAVLQTWLDGFKLTDPSPRPSDNRNEEHEALLAAQRELLAMGEDDDPLSKFPEFGLAFALEQEAAERGEDFN